MAWDPEDATANYNGTMLEAVTKDQLNTGLSGQLRFTDPDGEQITEIPVTPGESVLFRVDNTAGFDHNFHIGTEAELSVPNASDMPGIPTWSSGVQELAWEVPADVTSLKFGCTVPGHYPLMQGTFSSAS